MKEKMRVYHRYLGFFLVGIMAMYSISGIVLIFRQTNAFKVERQVIKTLQPNLNGEQLGAELKIRDLKVTSENGDLLTFDAGNYNKVTGEAHYKVMELPYLLDKMTHLHKANTNDALFVLNIFFGLSLFFFVVSSFWMFAPGTSTFRKGMYFVVAGVILVLTLIFV
ncbi:MAG: hypothetical protein WDO15_26525 [Bacteroidota bacterium]